MNAQGHLDACALKWDVRADSPCFPGAVCPSKISGIAGRECVKIILVKFAWKLYIYTV